MPEFYEGSHQQYDVICRSNVMIPMRDGVRMATDIYIPALGETIVSGKFPTILERTPYDKAGAGNVTNGTYFARRGYICAIQDVRGRFASEGEWYPFAKEAPDGYDTVEWLAAQEWSDGQIGTMGGSYCGSDQSALATLNPPHLSTMIVAVGASNYYHCSMRQNGALEQRFMIYAFRMATTSKEALADASIKSAVDRAFANVGEWVTRAAPSRRELRHYGCCQITNAGCSICSRTASMMSIGSNAVMPSRNITKNMRTCQRSISVVGTILMPERHAKILSH